MTGIITITYENGKNHEAVGLRDMTIAEMRVNHSQFKIICNHISLGLV
jgi:hypothetical protein